MSHLYRLQIPCFQTLSGHTGPVTCCAFDADGRSICTGGEDGDIRLWRFVGDSYRCAKVIELGPAITCCQFQPSGFEDLLATGSTDNVLRIWKAFEGDCIKTLQGHAEQVSSLSFNPMNGDLIVSGSHDLTARVWRVSKEKHLKELRGHKGPVVLCCYNPNGELVLTASQDKTLRLWNPKTGESVAVLKGHSKLVWGAAFHTKTEWIITGGQVGNGDAH
ncbi:hypothetical protein GUITHDRAFT_108433 [Guillardia theta CCMP2712]|uniref:Uncharacterized protein n=1 Tax=Guillardia theta (strain CCMP2712) TaxID=905079 RepID=L1JBU0_GUITC|nr:hypothetical protein GUITHDRAFT_108433 [Guillardia theta CCMP2712]EKX45560.1 hypothetical protein GUITHDRAFT_108433 [Guillardia theta CCMP2712]|eukprot:XP_005832540.1 hypothetical protein GUITHDRAFT_108433 [Guillardia theta CCMP2712]